MAKGTVYGKLREELLAGILGGRLQHGTYLPPENTLAAQYGISRPSVRLAVSELVALRLVERIPGKGTVVTHLSTEGRREIRFLFPDAFEGRIEAEGSPFSFSIVKAASEMCYALGYVPREDYVALDAVDKERCDGSIVIGPGPKEELVDELERKEVLFVSVVRCLNDRINYLTTDNYGGAYAAADFLAGLGRKRMLYLQPPLPSASPHAGLALKDRYRGFLDALRGHGLEHPESELTVTVPNSTRESYAAVKAILDRTRDVGAVFVGYGTKGVPGVLRALQEAGARVCEDIAVVGFKADILSNFHALGVSTVDLLVEELAHEAVRILAGLMKGDLQAPVQRDLGYRFYPGRGLPPAAVHAASRRTPEAVKR